MWGFWRVADRNSPVEGLEKMLTVLVWCEWTKAEAEA